MMEIKDSVLRLERFIYLMVGLTCLFLQSGVPYTPDAGLTDTYLLATGKMGP